MFTNNWFNLLNQKNFEIHSSLEDFSFWVILRKSWKTYEISSLSFYRKNLNQFKELKDQTPFKYHPTVRNNWGMKFEKSQHSIGGKES